MNPLRTAFCVLRTFLKVRRARVAASIAAGIVAACASGGVVVPVAPPLPAPSIVADTARAAVLADGVVHRYYWIASGPWAVNVLDVDRNACWTPVALKAGGRAVGREKTSILVSSYADSARRRGIRVAGGVNADFFSFSPPGVPVGAHIHDGLVITGPVDRPVLAVKRDGTPVLGVLSLVSDLESRAGHVSPTWNHPQPAQLTIVDRAFGERTDTATGAIEFVLQNIPVSALAPPLGAREQTRRSAGIVVAVDTARLGIAVPRDGFLLVAGSRADSASRVFVQSLSVGDTVSLSRRYVDVDPLEAVGGFPMLLRGDSILADTETAGTDGFRGRHPRTAVGLGAQGRRLLFVTVDGRQAGFSDGMTLLELAELMRKLGASEALNLDGGGSTAFVADDRTGNGTLRLANRPSDREGERPVANAIAIESVCGSELR